MRTAAGLAGLSPENQCILIVDFADLPLAMPVARVVDGRAANSDHRGRGGGSREELLQLMQAGVREVLPNFTQREIRQAATRAASTLATAGEVPWPSCTPSCPLNQAAAERPWLLTLPPWPRN